MKQQTPTPKLTSVPIEKKALDKIRLIAKEEDMKIYGVINKLLQKYEDYKNES